jgi:thioredoxin-like negative regulator of GroEL
VYGQSLGALERAWHAYLRTVPDLEALERRALEDLSASALVPAEQGFRALLRQDPSSLRARVALAVTLARRGDHPGAAGLVDETARVAGPAAAQRVRSALADALWRWGDPAAARRAMEALDPRLMGDDEARTHALKRAALTQGGAFARVLQTLLVGEGELDPSPAAALALAARAELQGPELRYLVARQLVQHERFADAVTLLGGEAPQDPRVRAEALRLRGVALFHLRRWPESEAAFAALRDDPTRPTGARDDAADWVDRVRRARSIP